jgi:hypothetical protein
MAFESAADLGVWAPPDVLTLDAMVEAVILVVDEAGMTGFTCRDVTASGVAADDSFAVMVLVSVHKIDVQFCK